MKLTMLGTGSALVTECYNTCFVMEDAGRCLLVDGGGGSTIRVKSGGEHHLRGFLGFGAPVG